jgi:A/G-specific adenine glycosylase
LQGPTRLRPQGDSITGMNSYAARLVAWQKQRGRHDLPWQNTRDPYRIWLSEIMLQQTQVTTVIPYYRRFLAALPDVRALAAAPLVEVLQLWSGLGYYRRAHLLHRAAQVVVADRAGIFPATARDLAALPGIGRSTAAAIAAFAFGERGAILDGNVKRVLARHQGVDGFPGDPAVERMLWQRAEALLPQRDIEGYTQALMDLGATVCLRREARCTACPVAVDCVAHREQRVAEVPAPRPKRTLPRRAVDVLLIERQGEVLLERRPATGIWAGLWSLPEIDAGGDPAQLCLARVGAAVSPGAPLPAIEHAFTHFRLTLTPRPCTVERWPKRAEEPGLLWLSLAETHGAALPAPIKALLRTRVRHLPR